MSAVLRILRQSSDEISSGPFRKDIELLRCDFRCPRLLTTKVKDLLSLSRECSHRTLFPWPPLRQAARCRIPQRAITAVRSERFHGNISKSALNIAPPLVRASPLGDCACPFLPHRLRVCFVGEGDHLRRPRCALAVPIPCAHSESRTPHCGCAAHHELELIAKLQRTRESLLDCMARCAP